MSKAVTKEVFGKTQEGVVVELFSLTNHNGVEVNICSYGGIITSIKTPDKQGKLADIVLGFDSLEEYLNDNPYFGCIVGRYANRIAKGRFDLDEKSYTLAQNNFENHLHGGDKGFDKIVWKSQIKQDKLELSYVSRNGEEGYPGELRVVVTYALTDANELFIDYRAWSDTNTIVNLTNHSYFNLAGSGDVLGHELLINADSFTPIDKSFIPLGKVTEVAGGPFDFRQLKAIGQHVDDADEQIVIAGGFDHNWVLNRQADGLEWAATVKELNTGRQMEVLTTKPGLQFYSANMLPSMLGKAGQYYQRRSGFCLETQYFPDSPNQPTFPSVSLAAGKAYEHSTVFRFSTNQD